MNGPAPRRRWFRKRGIDLGDLAVETFAAFLGVFIALSVQDWRDHQNSAIKLDKARSAIRSELEGNRELVQDKLKYLHQIERNGVALINGELAPQPNVSSVGDEALMRAAAKSALKNVCESIPGYTGFALPSLTRAAYDGAQTSGVLPTMDFDESRRIAGAYALQAIYGRAFESQTYLLQRLFDTQDRFICVAIVREEAYFSGELLSAYDAYLKDQSAKDQSASPR